MEKAAAKKKYAKKGQPRRSIPGEKFLLSVLTGAMAQYALSAMFLRKCTKPSRREYVQLLQAHAIGILFLGFLGYIITFIHIPINSILVGARK